MVLGIDSSDNYVSVGLADETGVLFSLSTEPGRMNKNSLHQFMERALKDADVEIGDVDGVSVSIGPGSFTGLRVGLAAAKGICWSLNIPLCGISSTEAIAVSFGRFTGKMVAVKDARRNRYYYGGFESDGSSVRRIIDDKEADTGTIAALVSDGYKMAGRREMLEDLSRLVSDDDFIEYDPEDMGGAIARAGIELISAKETLDVSLAAPIYVRNPELGG